MRCELQNTLCGTVNAIAMNNCAEGGAEPTEWEGRKDKEAIDHSGVTPLFVHYSETWQATMKNDRAIHMS
jgi:hypothetical protein